MHIYFPFELSFSLSLLSKGQNSLGLPLQVIFQLMYCVLYILFCANRMLPVM